MTLLEASGAGGDRHTIEIPPDLYRQLQRVLENSRFSSVDDFASTCCVTLLRTRPP
ncbi:MAG: hypothetical protein QOH48_995 [Actinomycetota bacterium]|jgi:hypothetical protein|nr:hypothetical protein [Actinomycetota bacterium]